MIILSLFLLLLMVIYVYSTRHFDYWKKRGVKFVKSYPVFGSLPETFFKRSSFTESFVKWYREYPNEKLVGFFRSSQPALLIRDPELIKRVIITDFAYFYERGIIPDKHAIEPILQNLFFAEGDLWRLLRQRITPAFTSGKLKNMFPLIVERAEHLQARALKAAKDGRTMDARDLMARYTTDFIGACGFGLDADSLNEEDSAFRKLGNDIFKVDLRLIKVTLLKEAFPSLMKNLKYFPSIERQICSLVKQILNERNYEPSTRNDFIDLLIEAKKKGTIEVESIENFKSYSSSERVKLELTDDLIAAQVFVFFAAGFETSSSATSFTLHKLAYYPEEQKKVQQEIDAVLKKHNNKLSYDAIKEMNYLDWAFKEGMRLFPSLGYLIRKCSKKYRIPGFDFSIDEGITVIIPLQALHTDPQYFEDPLEFKPTRFNPENFSDSNKYIYLPFGEGPRACIGERLGHMQSLAGLAAILSKFTVQPAPESTPIPPVEAKLDVVQSIDGGIPLLFIERKNLNKL